MTFASDPIQRTSPPLPRFQTEAGGKEPLPLGSPLEIRKQVEAEHRFETYLNSHADRTHEHRAQERALVFSTIAQLRDESLFASTLKFL